LQGLQYSYVLWLFAGYVWKYGAGIVHFFKIVLE